MSAQRSESIEVQITESQAAAAAMRKIQEALAVLGNGKRGVREMRSLILGLEAAMQQMPGYVSGDQFKTLHHFDQGIYMREGHIPAGFTVTGRIHKHGHLNLLTKGKITVWTEDGMKMIIAPAIIKSEPGIKRVGYAHEDSVWVTVHENPDDEREVKKVEARLFADTFQEAYLGSKRTFEDAIRYLGFTPDEVTALSENTADQVPFPAEPRAIRIANSPIHGLGMFAAIRLQKGDVIAPARIGGKRTPAGRYCNHGDQPNSEGLMRENGDVDLVAIKSIEPGEEILSDYYFNFTNSRDPRVLG